MGVFIKIAELQINFLSIFTKIVQGLKDFPQSLTHSLARSLTHSLTHSLFRLEDQVGWRLIFTSQYLDSTVEKISLNVKMHGTKTIAITSGKYFYC